MLSLSFYSRLFFPSVFWQCSGLFFLIFLVYKSRYCVFFVTMNEMNSYILPSKNNNFFSFQSIKHKLGNIYKEYRVNTFKMHRVITN